MCPERDRGGDPGDPADPVGGLPFTGLDLGAMSVAALAVVGTGVFIRRRAGTEES